MRVRRRLTALRYPERELVSVPARQVYWQPVRPLTRPADQVSRAPMDLDLDDVIGKRIITTRLSPTVTIREENAIAALEVMSAGVHRRTAPQSPPISGTRP